MRRNLLGLIGLAFLGTWIALLIWNPASGGYAFAAAACMRIGCVLLALWLALPQLSQLKLRLPAWLLASLIGSGLLIAVRPRLAIWLLPIMLAIAALQFVGWLFKPLPAGTKSRRSRADGGGAGRRKQQS